MKEVESLVIWLQVEKQLFAVNPSPRLLAHLCWRNHEACPRSGSKAGAVALKSLKSTLMPYRTGVSASELEQRVETAYVFMITITVLWMWKILHRNREYVEMKTEIILAAIYLCLHIPFFFSLKRNCGLWIFFSMPKLWNWKCAAFSAHNPATGRTLLFMFSCCFAQWEIQ